MPRFSRQLGMNGAFRRGRLSRQDGGLKLIGAEVGAMLKATIRKVTTLAKGFLTLNRYEFEVEQHRGGVRVLTWDVMERGHAVGVLGYDPVREEVVLIEEFRPGALVAGDYPFFETLVAGAIDGSESPIDAAVREMKEEANLELRTPVLVHPGAYVSSGGTSEKLSIVVGVVDASNAGGVHGNPHETEDIKSVVLSTDEFLRRVRNAQFADMKTLVAGYWLAENRKQFS
jgi:ADP-ribose pyrophosphatase